MLETPEVRAETDAALLAWELQQQELLRQQEVARRQAESIAQAAAYFVNVAQAAAAKVQRPIPAKPRRKTQEARVVMTKGTVRCPHCKTQLRVTYATHVRSLQLKCAKCLRPFPAATGQ